MKKAQKKLKNNINGEDMKLDTRAMEGKKLVEMRMLRPGVSGLGFAGLDASRTPVHDMRYEI